MPYLSRRAVLKSMDQTKIVETIHEAELRTSGEIRVSVAPFFWGKVRKVAEKAFLRLGMTETQQRNAILFFVVPARRRFVILGDIGIHKAVGQEFWDSLASLLSGRFKKGEFTEGLSEGIKVAGEKLAEHFPYDAATDTNELPDKVDFSGPRLKRKPRPKEDSGKREE